MRNVRRRGFIAGLAGAAAWPVAARAQQTERRKRIGWLDGTSEDLEHGRVSRRFERALRRSDGSRAATLRSLLALVPLTRIETGPMWQNCSG